MDTENSLSLVDRKELTRVIEHALDDLMEYYVNTIREANRQYKVKNKDFWNGMFVTKQATQENDCWKIQPSASLLFPKDHPTTPVPQDPYIHLDIQACSKYLIHGEKRIRGMQRGTRLHRDKREQYIKIADDTPIFLEDSKNFFKYFQMTAEQKQDYTSVLYNAINLRNNRKHQTISSYQKMSLPMLSSDVETLSQMMEPFRRLQEVPGNLPPVQALYEKIQGDIRACLGGCPISVTDLSKTLFPDNDDLAQKKVPHIIELLSLAGFRKDDDFVVADCMPELLTQAVMAFVQSQTGAPTEQDAAALLAFLNPQETVEELPVVKPEVLPRDISAVLSKCGRLLPRHDQIIDALLNGFQLMADESIFLCTEGRRMLKDLVPMLKKLGQPLHLDHSVIASLYLKYRRSKTLPAELLQLSGEDPKLILKNQEAVHSNCKLALKALRSLREDNCIVSVASPSAASYSYENIRTVAKTFQEHRFFVLSMDRQLAKELGALPSKNAVVAKVTLDGKLLLWGETLPAWQELLGPGADESTALLRQPLVPRSTPAPTAPEGRSNCGSFLRLDAVERNGTRTSVMLLKKLGEGGEGAVYETTHPAGLAAKVYHPDKRKESRRDKLAYMFNHDPGIENLAWPCAMLYNQEQEWVGYLMPKAPGKVLEDVVFHPGIDWKNIRSFGWSRRHLAKVGANIARTFARMHSCDMLMGDVNPRNMMVSPDCSVYFVDCDSYQFGGFECPVGKPDYTPPEVHIRMRAEGITEYRYIRTAYNEVYSLAVLLFSILLPGKAPYAARNAGYDDVVDAVIAGHFPYPYDGDENAVPKGNMMAPAGVFRNIWSHMTHQMKVHFYETFTQTGDGRRNAQQWEQALREYIRQIELGHSTDELAPTGYKDTSRNGIESASRMIDLVCGYCGQKFNIAEDVYQRRKGRIEQNYCGRHYEIMRNLQKQSTKTTCSKCGKRYEITAYDMFVREETGVALLCDDCENVTVTCDDCGASFRKNRQQVEELRRRRAQLWCRSCYAIHKNR